MLLHRREEATSKHLMIDLFTVKWLLLVIFHVIFKEPHFGTYFMVCKEIYPIKCSLFVRSLSTVTIKTMLNHPTVQHLASPRSVQVMNCILVSRCGQVERVWPLTPKIDRALSAEGCPPPYLMGMDP